MCFSEAYTESPVLREWLERFGIRVRGDAEVYAVYGRDRDVLRALREVDRVVVGVSPPGVDARLAAFELRELSNLGGVECEVVEVAVYDVDRERCREAERTHGVRCVGDVDELVRAVEIVVEAASAQAVLEYACRVLEAGRHLVVASTGALSKLPRCGTGYVFAMSGGAGGVDVAASTGGRVRHVVRKAAAAGEDSGPAEELYWRYPQSLNTSMTYKLAGAGEVWVELRRDAPPGYIIHEVEHQWGRVQIRAENKAEGTTSYAAALSLYNTLKNAARLVKGGRVVVGTFAVL
ncbi:DUF108 domain-containing protein [Pyrobaculum ferrireducens]|uniref:Nicotinate-nucleotide pyrophosphorylase n=1 Tax=Pyrobaculum ferrireducens TaxID=1104324 RepID=G7VBJ7_9CREN|nr:DUF108 domain-containing protein [Pyrobaculum ferrireducens]AET32427.1 nicotinate-nucleotide pyrophosphorylase [Pyrobaculum ferrireducens]